MDISRENRAKQFLPFDSLKGLQEALREKEIEYEEKIELTEDSKEEISKILCTLDIGDKVKIKYYNSKKYNVIIGTVKEISSITKKIILEENQIIKFENILSISNFFN